MVLSRIFCCSAAILFFANSAHSAIKPLTEVDLIKSLRLGSPELDRIRGASSQVDFESLTVQRKFETKGTVGYDYSTSNEDGMASFIPVYSPTKTVSVGVAKQTPYGVKVGVEGFANSINTKSGVINDAARAGTKVSLEIDLLKNLLGRMDLSELRSAKANSERARVLGELSRNEFELEVRKLFWSIVANGYSLQLSEALIATAKKQLQDSTRRLRAGNADQGDVARNTAMVQSRESSAYLFRYEREKLLGQLRKWVPALAEDELQPKANDLDTTIREVLKCVDQITANPKLKPTETDYYTMIDWAEKQFKAESRKAKATGDWDLKATSYYQQSGVDQGFGNAIDEYNTNKKDGYGFGVALTIPLEGTASKAENAHKRFVNDQLGSQVEIMRLKVQETHKEVVKALALLRDVARTQNANVEALEKSVSSTQRKYRQARISLTQLVSEQDTLFNSQLQVIQTKLSVIHALYDYFKVANHSSCHLNKMAGS